MSRESIREREALEELLQSQGWAYVCAYLAKEWQGDGYQSRIAAALGRDDIAEAKIVHRTAMHMRSLPGIIENRVRDLKGME